MEKKDNNLIERPPVVVIMGHIDHGKSTLLDYIRKSNIVGGEAGGITQHIAAYEVEHEGEAGTKKITFLDTPGHEAFQAVRARGASIADIAVLIVSAEDGVMPQTKEALNAIKEDGMPFVVAINKVDSNKANIDKTKSSLIENEVYLEGMGGDISYVEISAKTGQNVEELLNLILLAIEIEELKGDPSKNAEGVVVEAHKDKQKGISATLIIKDGTIKKGMFVAGHTAMSPVRAILDHNGNQLEEASFSSPITIFGWTDIPPVGSDFKSFTSKKEAESYCKECGDIDELEKNNKSNKTFDDETEVIPLIIKTDVSGTGEAIEHELEKVDVENVEFNIIGRGTGNISEANMKVASANDKSVVVGFNVSLDPQAEAVRERENVTTKTFNIIYELTDWLKGIAEERRPLKEIEEVTGSAKVLKVFNKTKKSQVIGGKVKEGELNVGSKVKIMRRDEEIDTGTIKGLQQQKSEATTVKEENEFGAAIETRVEIAPGDYIQAFKKVVK